MPPQSPRSAAGGPRRVGPDPASHDPIPHDPIPHDADAHDPDAHDVDAHDAIPHDADAHDPAPLPLTGERTVPGVADERYWFERHVVAYRLAAATLGALERPTVLDAGCGEGYGLAMLVEAGAGRVIGADYDATTVTHARRTYADRDPRIEVLHSELLALPVPDATVAVTVSFQVIEHVYDVPGYLASLHRVTRPGGQVVIATPNRLTFTPGSDTPVNPFHVREFTADELVAELRAAGLEVVEVVGVHHGERLRAAEREHGPRLLQRLADDPATWPSALRALVHEVDSSWFDVRTDELDAALDLIVRCRVPADGNLGDDA